MTSLDEVGLAVDQFQHEAFLYRDDEHFVRYLACFIRDGLDNGEVVAVAEPPARIEMLRDWLGRDARHVEFIDMTEIGVNPARIIAVWKAFVDEQRAAERGMRGVGEPAWPGRRSVELDECGMHELLLNRAFATGPAWRLLCPYDAAQLPPDVLNTALRTHPLRSDACGTTRCVSYCEDAILDAFEAPLPPVPPTARRIRFTISTLATLRRAIGQFAAAHDLPPDRVDDLVLACSEIAANSTRYGGGSGDAQLWAEPHAVIVQLTDRGHIREPLVGRTVPPPEGIGGRGIYLANQLCDLVQLRSSRDGTTARLTTWTETW